ncbi:MAG TPA: helix-turn-helix transcriptional regulator [Terriglobales bacterium]|jgi:PadR family transcriptional regulator, regulatory protein PadR|nr:helix-turn-helix transcriptional regulator [Terriglobales bacterium]
MMGSANLSYTAALILQTISAGYNYGFDIMDVTSLASGTVYPALRRLEQQGLIKSRWERERAASAEQRPPRRYYGLMPQGKDALASALRRYRLLEQLSKSEPVRPR